MAKFFKVKTIGFKKFSDRMRKFPLQVEQGLRIGLFTEAEKIMGESKKLVPVITTALKNSGFVELPKDIPGGISVSLGYGGPAVKYALRVHENPRSGKTGGASPTGQQYKRWSRVGQWKYLEVPFRQNQKGMRGRILSVIRNSIKAGAL